nr:MAG TPA: Baseplate structural protein [Caudoviricetes sp.]
MTVDELANVTGDLEFRKMESGTNIVDCFIAGKNNCFVVRLGTGDSWAYAMAQGKNTALPVDVAHLEFGRDIPHNTLQPSKAVYIWLRTA